MARPSARMGVVACLAGAGLFAACEAERDAELEACRAALEEHARAAPAAKPSGEEPVPADVRPTSPPPAYLAPLGDREASVQAAGGEDDDGDWGYGLVSGPSGLEGLEPRADRGAERTVAQRDDRGSREATPTETEARGRYGERTGGTATGGTGVFYGGGGLVADERNLEIVDERSLEIFDESQLEPTIDDRWRQRDDDLANRPPAPGVPGPTPAFPGADRPSIPPSATTPGFTDTPPSQAPTDGAGTVPAR